MAQISGAAIFPLFFSSKNAWITGSWDKFLIPKPFTQVLVRWGEPVMVPKDADESRQEAVRLEVEKRLREGHQRDDLIWKWKTPL
jgi:hypothetical protein